MRLSALTSALLLTACATTPPGATRLADIAANPAAYHNVVVTTCGWATNQFEDVQITTSFWRRGSSTPGLEVSWQDKTPQTSHRPEWRCVTGYVEPSCVDDEGNGEEFICISTGSPYQWTLVEGRS